jgi:hypothetical protein
MLGHGLKQTGYLNRTVLPLPLSALSLDKRIQQNDDSEDPSKIIAGLSYSWRVHTTPSLLRTLDFCLKSLI